MAGNREGGLKAAKTAKERHGENFYKRIGTLGGEMSRGGGFTKNSERARELGRIGGKTPKKKRD
jgi:general stress protein YciG